jgi:thiol-disulfide isomerase/thioredoxin
MFQTSDRTGGMRVPSGATSVRYRNAYLLRSPEYSRRSMQEPGNKFGRRKHPDLMTRSLLVLAAAGLLAHSVTAAPPERAARFALNDLQHRRVALTDFAGQVVLLNFWATWCAPCIAEIPSLIDLHERFRERGFTVIGIAMDEESAVARFVATRRFAMPAGPRTLNYPVLMGTDATADAYGGVETFPTSVLVDREGRIAARVHGPVNAAEMDRAVRLLLEGKHVARWKRRRGDE